MSDYRDDLELEQTALVAAEVAALNELNGKKANDADVLHKTGDESKTGSLDLSGSLAIGPRFRFTPILAANYTYGTLVKTDIDDNASVMFELYIFGNPYSGSNDAINTVVTGYQYLPNTVGFTALKGLSDTEYSSPIKVFNYEGKLCFWLPYINYYVSYRFALATTIGNQYYANITSVTNEALPTTGTTKLSDVPLAIRATRSWVNSNFATAAQGALADSAFQNYTNTISDANAVLTDGFYKMDTGSANFPFNWGSMIVKKDSTRRFDIAIGLIDNTKPYRHRIAFRRWSDGDIYPWVMAWTDDDFSPSDFATSAQGELADTALQPGALAGYALVSQLFSGNYNDLSNKPTLYSDWKLWTNGSQKTTIGSGAKVDFQPGANIHIGYAAGGVVTISVQGLTINDIANLSTLLAGKITSTGDDMTGSLVFESGFVIVEVPDVGSLWTGLMFNSKTLPWSVKLAVRTLSSGGLDYLGFYDELDSPFFTFSSSGLRIGTGGKPRSKLDVEGDARIDTLPNAPGYFVRWDPTDKILSHRTPLQTKTDLGLVTVVSSTDTISLQSAQKVVSTYTGAAASVIMPSNQNAEALGGEYEITIGKNTNLNFLDGVAGNEVEINDIHNESVITSHMGSIRLTSIAGAWYKIGV